MRRTLHELTIMYPRLMARYNPQRSYTFFMRGRRWRGFLPVFLILGVPSLWVLVPYRGGVPTASELGSMLFLSMIAFGALARLKTNKVTTTPHELIISKDYSEVRLPLTSVETAFIADEIDELDELPLPPSHYPLELEGRDRDVVVLVLRDGATVESAGGKYDGVLTKYVSFTVRRPEHLLSCMRMRF